MKCLHFKGCSKTGIEEVIYLSLDTLGFAFQAELKKLRKHQKNYVRQLDELLQYGSTEIKTEVFLSLPVPRLFIFSSLNKLTNVEKARLKPLGYQWSKYLLYLTLPFQVFKLFCDFFMFFPRQLLNKGRLSSFSFTSKLGVFFSALS